MTHRRTFLKNGLLSIAALSVSARSMRAVDSVDREAIAEYVCPPCLPCRMDDRIFNAPGRCPGCGMQLIPRPVKVADANLSRTGNGAFTIPGGIGHEKHSITVSFYRPASYNTSSPILLVLPGSGRNGTEYRDAWKEVADAKGVFVAALTYPEKDYDFAAYQMGGVIRNLRMQNLPVNADGSTPAVVRLRDEDITFDVNDRADEWLFRDFDRIFEVLVTALGSSRTSYDLFGHSAGGQILHRYALLHPHSRADRIIAANAGFYTLPDLDTTQVLGLKGTGATRTTLAAALSAKLTVLLGEQDDSGEEGGINLHTPKIDVQGIGRLQRGRYFFKKGEALARDMGVPFAWKLHTVPNVGHEYQKMSAAAGEILFG